MTGFGYYSVKVNRSSIFLVKVEEQFKQDFLRYLTETYCTVQIRKVKLPETVEYDPLSISLVKDGRRFNVVFPARRF